MSSPKRLDLAPCILLGFFEKWGMSPLCDEHDTRMRFVVSNGQLISTFNKSVGSRRILPGTDWWLLCCAVIALPTVGCRRSVPIHVWHPPQATVPIDGRVAIAPIAGNRQLAERIEQALLSQRPQHRSDLALFTPQQLLESSAVRLASTALLTSDVLSIQAARGLGASVLLQGEILDADIDLQPTQEKPKVVNWNQAFFRKPEDQVKHEKILMSWRVIDVSTSRTLGTASFNLETQAAIKQYPELDFVEHDQTQLLISASARESWKTVAPFVTKDQVRLAVPWLQPGSFTVRRGVAAAKKGNWDLAQQRWERTAKFFWFNSAAHHNLALAHAAREDFPAAKEELQKATGPLSLRLPPETLVWLDQQHRYHNQSLGLGTPVEGWSFPDLAPQTEVASVPTVDVATLPWWTALPLAKPPGWTWQGWLTQPWAF